MRDIHYHLSNHYRLTETAKPNIGQSLFFHDVVSHSHYDDKKFEPKFDVNLPPDSTIHETDLDRVCSQSAACKYDYIITGDAGYAAQTKKDEAAAEIMSKEMKKQVIRCPALPKPTHGRKSENRYWPGTIVRFACDTGYRLIGYEVRRCREDGLWSWGVDAECIPDLTYKLTVAGIFIGVILPVVIILVLFFFCWKRDNEKRKYLTEQKPIEYLPNKRPNKPNQTKTLSSNSASDLNTEYRTSDSIESRQHPSSYPKSTERTTTQPGHLV